MPHVRVLSTGGTIASTSTTATNGKTPSVSGDALIDAVPEITEYATIDVKDVCQVSGFQMEFETATRTLDAIDRAGRDVDGVVVTHGTDTMAESAYYCSLAAETDVPVVFTGAQRSFDQRGTDGPTNLLTAVQAAGHDRFRSAGGSYLAFNETIHAARWVVKSHTSALETFCSPSAGPIAEDTPNGLRFLQEPGPVAEPISGSRIDPTICVELVTNAMGVDGQQVDRALDAGVDAIVVAGTGLGNTTGELGRALETAIDHGIPVVLTSRCHAGTTAGVYGGPGGAKTLLETGAIAGGDLPVWKARLRTAIALSATAGEETSAAESAIDRVRTAFEGIDSIA